MGHNRCGIGHLYNSNKCGKNGELENPKTSIKAVRRDYELVVKECRDRGFEVGTGEFGADMKVTSVNDGPVTIVLDI